MRKKLINLDTKRKQMITNQNFHEDFEREALKDSVYLLEEQDRIMQEINKEENRLPATIEIIGTLPKLNTDEVECNTLPF